MKWSDAGGGSFEQAPIGTHVARCIRIIDIGTQSGEYKGKPVAHRKNMIMWELPDSLMADGDMAGKPFIVSKFYTASLSEKANLRHDLVNWRGREFTEEELKAFDPKRILGTVCLLSITANDNGKSRITAIMAAPKGTQTLSQINPSVFFSLDEFNPAVFDSLSKGVKALIEKSPEYAEIITKAKSPAQTGPSSDDFDDDIPF